MKWEKVEKQSDPAAVKTDDLTGEIGVFIAEMIDQVSYLLGTPQAACGDFIHQGNPATDSSLCQWLRRLRRLPGCRWEPVPLPGPLSGR